MSFNRYPWAYPNLPNTSVPIAGQTEATYQNYKKLKQFEDVGYFLQYYVVSGGEVTINLKRTDTIDVSDIVASLNDDIMERDGTSFQATGSNLTYYLDFDKSGDWWWANTHPLGTSGTDYLQIAVVTTDNNGVINDIIDVRGHVGGFLLKDEYGLENYATIEQLTDIAINVKRPPFFLPAAKGDGVTDDTNAIKACIDYANANGINTILIPPDSYVVNELAISGKLSIMCKGANFISGDKETIIMSNFSGHLVGLTIQANSTSPSLNAIRMVSCSNVTLSEVTINPCGYIGIYLYQCKNVVLDRVSIINWGAVGVYTETCERVVAVRCNIVGGAKTTSHCIQFNRGKYNTAADNYLEKGRHFGLSFVQESRSQARNNTCYNTYAEAINLEGASNCVVDGNNCFWDLGVSTDFGICIYGPDTSKYANLNIVTNNVIARCGKAGIALADLCLFNKVSNNSIYDGNQLGVTDVDGMITLYQQAGTTGPANNMISDNSGSGDKFNYLVKENVGSSNYFSNNYIQSYKPSLKTSNGSIIQNPQLTWIDYSPSITAVTGTITSMTVDKAEYAFDGEFIRLNIKFHITTNGTGAGQIRIPLPVNAASGVLANASLTAVETQVSGVALYINLITSELFIRKYDGSYPGANGSVFQLSGYYNYLR